MAIICTGNEIAMGEAAEFWQQSDRNQTQNARHWTVFYKIGARRSSGKNTELTTSGSFHPTNCEKDFENTRTSNGYEILHSLEQAST